MTDGRPGFASPRREYEQGLSARLQEARDNKIDQLRRKLEKMTAGLRAAQYQVIEALAESWAFLKNEAKLSGT
jgi:hypothetical protein